MELALEDMRKPIGEEYYQLIHSGCGEVKWKGREYGTTSEAITKSTIIAIILLLLRSFQRKGLCGSSLKAKSITFECC